MPVDADLLEINYMNARVESVHTTKEGLISIHKVSKWNRLTLSKLPRYFLKYNKRGPEKE
jgi:hypothetical protein